MLVRSHKIPVYILLAVVSKYCPFPYIQRKQYQEPHHILQFTVSTNVLSFRCVFLYKHKNKYFLYKQKNIYSEQFIYMQTVLYLLHLYNNKYTKRLHMQSK